MSLKNNPTNLKLAQLGLESEAQLPGSVPRELIQRANAGTYLAAAYTLGHGRRDLMPLTIQWNRANAMAHFLRMGKVEDATIINKDWCATFFNFLRDSLLDMPDAAMVSYELGGERTVNVPELLSAALDRLKAGQVPEGERCLLDALAMDAKTTELLNLVGKFCGVAALVTLHTQRHALDKREGQQGDPHLARAVAVIQSQMGGTFAHTAAQVAEAFAGLQGKQGMEDVWDAMSTAMCRTDIRVELTEPPAQDTESAHHRRGRRWLSGSIPADIAEERDVATSQTLREALDQVSALSARHKLPVNPDALRNGLLHVSDYVDQEVDNFVPMTFMRPEAFDLFSKTGETLTVWDLSEMKDFHKTWHHRYTDVPLHGRAVTDNRLYGERGRYLTYGALIHRGMTDQIANLSEMYGTHVVTWKRESLQFSTLTLNDSQLAPYVVPATKMMVKKLAFAFMAPRLLGMPAHHPLPLLISKCMFGDATYPDFIECQMHNSMVMADVSDVMDLA
jgi:hypothetical protein